MYLCCSFFAGFAGKKGATQSLFREDTQAE
jgi:hypothetical protein